MRIAAVFAIFGFNTAILKLCSEKRSLGEKYFIFRSTLLYTTISTASVLILLFIMAKLQILSPDEDINNLLPIFMLGIPAGVIINMTIFYLQSLKQVIKMANAQIYFRVFSIFSISDFDLFMGMTGFIASVIISGYMFLFRIYEDTLKNTLRKYLQLKISSKRVFILLSGVCRQILLI